MCECSVCGQKSTPKREWQAFDREPCQQWSIKNRGYYPIGTASFAAYLDTPRVPICVKMLYH